MIFRKRYTCSMEDRIQECLGECPYVRTVRYVVRPHWEQIDVGDECPEALLEILDALPALSVPGGSSMARCLQCAYDKCYLEEQPGEPCSDSAEDGSEARNEFDRIKSARQRLT